VRQARAEAPGDWLNFGIDPDLVEAFTRRSFMRHGDGWLRRPTLEEIDQLSRLDARQAILPANDVYERLQVPAGFVFARHGLYRDRRAEVECLARKIGAQFVELDAGHNLHMQQPAALGEAIRDLANRV
jgi:pimeloyl-ACP methyl ester carboxylesterase